MRWMVTHGKLLLDQFGDTAASPNVTAKAEGLGAFEQPGDQLRLLLKTKPGRGAGSGVVTQRLRPVQRGALEPLADRTLANTERVGDLLLGPALFVQFPSTLAAPRTPTDRRVVLCGSHDL